MKSERPENKKRKPGIKANYEGASPEQVARALYWHRRKKTSRRVQPTRS